MSPETEIRIPIESDADIVLARQKGREIAGQLGFSATHMTMIATAISEVSRNIIKFAKRGEILIRILDHNPKKGVVVIARDQGPGIPDIHLAIQDGYSTGHGLGLGLPGCRRLMDEFELESELGKGTVVTMKKWVPYGTA